MSCPTPFEDAQSQRGDSGLLANSLSVSCTHLPLPDSPKPTEQFLSGNVLTNTFSVINCFVLLYHVYNSSWIEIDHVLLQRDSFIIMIRYSFLALFYWIGVDLLFQLSCSQTNRVFSSLISPLLLTKSLTSKFVGIDLVILATNYTPLLYQFIIVHSNSLNLSDINPF